MIFFISANTKCYNLICLHFSELNLDSLLQICLSLWLSYIYITFFFGLPRYALRLVAVLPWISSSCIFCVRRNLSPIVSTYRLSFWLYSWLFLYLSCLFPGLFLVVRSSCTRMRLLFFLVPSFGSSLASRCVFAVYLDMFDPYNWPH